MTKVLILGAGGRIAKHVIRGLSGDTSFQLTLYLRKPKKLAKRDAGEARIIEGDVMDFGKLIEVMTGQDIVYANLDGPLDELTENIIKAMKSTVVHRILLITTVGIYDEVPGAFGEWNNRMLRNYLPPFQKAAEWVETSGLDYTIIRPAWLTDEDEIDYETTRKGEPFKGTIVSRKSVADLVMKMIKSPKLFIGESLGINKPGTEGDRPFFYK